MSYKTPENALKSNQIYSECYPNVNYSGLKQPIVNL